ncbi:hypothetical protein [Achromobacter sp. Root565]|uniref:hypothetical protein n=1 Tax=Achromobacter TaxID=222 RepID=UPI000B09DC77|nr:hypothetical protein [Achromobacter sp. Root565]
MEVIEQSRPGKGAGTAPSNGNSATLDAITAAAQEANPGRAPRVGFVSLGCP